MTRHDMLGAQNSWTFHCCVDGRRGQSQWNTASRMLSSTQSLASPVEDY